MLNEFLNFLGLDKNKTSKKQPIKTDDADIKEKAEEFIIEAQNQHFQEEITTEAIIKNGKKIEIKKIKTTEPLNNGKTLITTKIYKKDITRM
ncbi:hypothetical protein [Campylobacter hyointestinalis]|uniref:hypothetical protein n=1 Tax=Campylobacter hyointestinalis TaxID=198 RepID=UPI000CE322B2|nr:hypothetical protein [Campylobacter hyointestinalis]PPB66436.1 hypothetical protein CDQ76_08915 [Campylobacter hyointestinalis subsp. hyointestinalis]